MTSSFITNDLVEFVTSHSAFPKDMTKLNELNNLASCPDNNLKKEDLADTAEGSVTRLSRYGQ